MKAKGLIYFVGVLLLVSACASAAGTPYADPIVPRFTTETGLWIDTTGAVNQETIRNLKNISNEAEKNGFQIAGAIFRNSASEEIEFTTKVGNENGIGNARKDNGIMIAVFLDKKGSDGNTPVVAIAVGSGLEGLLNDAKIGRFLDTYFVPERKNGNWEKGLVDTVNALSRYLQNPQAEEFKDPPVDYALVIFAIIVIGLLLVLDGVFTRFQITLMLLEALSSGRGTNGVQKIGHGGSFSGGGTKR